jgi:hypothetical protein
MRAARSAALNQIAEHLPVIILFRQSGFSLREIETKTGISRSTLGRFMPHINQLTAEILAGKHDHLGELAEIVRIACQVSQLGQKAIESPQEIKLLTERLVPNGTEGAA